MGHGDYKGRDGVFPVMMVEQGRVQKVKSARKEKSSEPVLHTISISLFLSVSIIPLHLSVLSTSGPT